MTGILQNQTLSKVFIINYIADTPATWKFTAEVCSPPFWLREDAENCSSTTKCW